MRIMWIGDFFASPPAERERIKDWIREHGVDPDHGRHVIEMGIGDYVLLSMVHPHPTHAPTRQRPTRILSESPFPWPTAMTRQEQP